MDPKVKWLIIAIKEWSQACGLLSSASFTTYALTWLVLFYLMRKNLVPSVESLMVDTKTRLIQGWPYELKDDAINVPKFEESETKLFKDFFTFYSNFDFQKCVVSPRSGELIKKFAMAKCLAKKLPKEMSSYIAYVHQHDLDEDDRFIISPCCVQDPFDLGHNITKQVTNPVLENFKKYCDRTNIEILLWVQC